MTKIVLLSFTLISLTAISLYGQKDAPSNSPSTIEEAEKLYEYRITRKYLNGRYIPIDILDACRELSRLSDPLALDKYKNANEDVISSRLHFGLGKWITRNWGLIEGSRYSHYLKQMGISHPDDMIRFTLIIWHRQLNNNDLQIKELAEHFITFRKNEWEAQKAKREVIYEGPQ